ncbi:MAG TPA: long-chain fatty acid--CoA ligase [Candidatus Hydrogenedentes bacterium]|nr:long-chain fatty acid--CoA ligase [Candidatus Hydrogenedentota bacterium]
MSLNLAECLEISAAVTPDKTAILFEDWRYTYAELAAAARRVANVLHQKGIRPGDRVAMMLPNTPHFPMVYYGILLAGAVAAPMNVMLRKREILHRLRDAQAKAFFVFDLFASEGAMAFDQAPDCGHFIVVEADNCPTAHGAGESFTALIEAASPEWDAVQTMPDDVAAILYASAVDGRMRGAQLTHFNLFQNAHTVKEYALGYYRADVCVTVLPLFHGFGQTTMMNAPVLAQSTMILLPAFEPGRVLELVERERATILAVVPTMVHFLVHHKRAAEADLSSLRCVITGGAAMPVPLAAQFTERFGVPVLEGYGLTETSPVACWNPDAERNRPGSIGLPIWGVRMRIMREDGTFAAPGEQGEIVMRGHNVMKGYLNLPEVNAEVFRGGWLHTGDLGYVDEDGYFHITGLKKDMINRAGMNVYPREVEAVILEHPAICEAAVVGYPDAVRGEEVMAYVVLEPDISLTAREVTEFCRERIAAYKAPRRVEFVAELPRDAAGLVDKRRLRGL